MTTERVARARAVADTAFSIAVVRAEESERGEHDRLFEDPYAATFAAAGAHVAESTQRFLDLPFFRNGVRLRTRYIDDAVRDGLAAGLDQLVLLGAGFDARGLRMHEVTERGARVYEVDTEEQLDRKRTLLAGAKIKVPSHVAYVGCDFDEEEFHATLAESLERNGFRRRGGAIFVWEGVIGYIGSDEIDRSLAFIAREGGPRSRVAFTFGPGSFEPTSSGARTREAGFTSCEETDGDAVWRRYLRTDPPPDAHYVKLATAIV